MTTHHTIEDQPELTHKTNMTPNTTTDPAPDNFKHQANNTRGVSPTQPWIASIATDPRNVQSGSADDPLWPGP
eukprot:595652-Heterocapsa_arctica.AAC.1